MVLHLAEQLDVPLRERNELLLAAGYAPAMRERALDGRSCPVREAIDGCSGHEPLPGAGRRPPLGARRGQPRPSRC